MKNNLQIFNTLTNQKETFKPIKGKKVNMFVCGPTVYDYPHIGNARTYIIFDVFVKYLKYLGYSVFYLQNITDIDDKIIAGARAKGVSADALANAFAKDYMQNMKALGVDSVSKYAYTTKYIKEVISQVQRLLKKDFAYVIDGDGIYFDISKFPNYGKLSGRTALQAEDGVSRIDYSKDKRNRGDFCIWKLKQESSEPSWPSPFGEGRPGWHIEDTAITEKFFGPQYDIHGAARDLIFPHHEAEITLMESISEKEPLAKYWMHAGFLTVDGQKMSKSLNNFITIGDLMKRCAPQYLRFMIVKNLWQSPMDYSESALIEVKAAIERIEDFLRKLKIVKNKTNGKESAALLKNLKNNFFVQLDDNFNTPQAFAVIFDFIKNTNQLLEQNLVSKSQALEIYKFFGEINKIFGVIDFKKVSQPIPAEIKKLALAREKFRKQKDWEKSDEMRHAMEKQGYSVEDTKDGPIIKKIN